jgi:hypothetical protein
MKTMPIPDSLIDFLAERYQKACIDSTRLPFAVWAAIEAERLGWKL